MGMLTGKQGYRGGTRDAGNAKNNRAEQCQEQELQCWGHEEDTAHHGDTALQKSTPLDIGHGPTEGVEPAQPVH